MGRPMNRPSSLDRKPDLLGRLSARLQRTCRAIRCADRPSVRRGLGEGAHEAAKAGLIDPVLVGPQVRIEQGTGPAPASTAGAMPIVATEHSHAAAAQGRRDGAGGRGRPRLMKGSLHTDELMEAAVAADGLRTARRMSHVFVLDVPAYDRLLLVTDAAINIAPDLDAKKDIVQNAIDLAHALGVDRAAGRDPVGGGDGERAHPVDGRRRRPVQDGRSRPDHRRRAGWAARLRQRHQHRGGAGRRASSPTVAGRADILIAPDLEAGNILAKQLSYFAGADSAGIVMGARCPIALTSRADPVESRLASAASLALVSAHRQEMVAITA